MWSNRLRDPPSSPLYSVPMATPVELDSYSPRLYRLIEALYISVKAYDDAIETMKKGLGLFPENSFMRSLKERSGNAQGQGGSGSKKPS